MIPTEPNIEILFWLFFVQTVWSCAVGLFSIWKSGIAIYQDKEPTLSGSMSISNILGLISGIMGYYSIYFNSQLPLQVSIPCDDDSTRYISTDNDRYVI